MFIVGRKGNLLFSYLFLSKLASSFEVVTSYEITYSGESLFLVCFLEGILIINYKSYPVKVFFFKKNKLFYKIYKIIQKKNKLIDL